MERKWLRKGLHYFGALDLNPELPRSSQRQQTKKLE
jgi:hypothetical protein